MLVVNAAFDSVGESCPCAAVLVLSSDDCIESWDVCSAEMSVESGFESVPTLAPGFRKKYRPTIAAMAAAPIDAISPMRLGAVAVVADGADLSRVVASDGLAACLGVFSPSNSARNSAMFFGRFSTSKANPASIAAVRFLLSFI